MKIDNLYIPDPYSGSSLEPKNCYIDFPYWGWPNHNPRRPSNDDYYRPYVPPYRPYTEGENHAKTLKEAFEKLRGEDKHFTKIASKVLKFRLELPGYAKENICVTVDKTGTLTVKSVNHENHYNVSWVVPDYQNYELESPAAQMSNGLLEIFFSPKKEEKAATIKIL
jgi:hypothetical protein